MWYLIKTDLSYNKKYIIFSLVYSILFILLYGLSGEMNNTQSLYTPLSISFWMFFVGRWGNFLFNKENIERTQASLPLAYKDIAAARILSGLILWSFLLAVTLLSYSIFLTDYTSLNFGAVFLINGLALCINAFLYVWHDFIFIKPGRKRKLISYAFYYPVAAIIISVVYLTTSATFPIVDDLRDSFRSIFFNGFVVVAENLGGILLSVLSYYMYQNRSSYLITEFGIKANIKVKTGDIT